LVAGRAIVARDDVRKKETCPQANRIREMSARASDDTRTREKKDTA